MFFGLFKSKKEHFDKLAGEIDRMKRIVDGTDYSPGISKADAEARLQELTAKFAKFGTK